MGRSETFTLVQLVNYRWTLPVIAELYSTNGSKFVTLCRRLGVDRGSLRRAVSTLAEQALVERNPGYGHPMRPEYILTDAGRALGSVSERLVDAVKSLDIETLAFQKWSLPVVHTLNLGATRFSAIRTHLPSITSRALSLTLKDLDQAEVVDRTAKDEYPPISAYSLTRTGTRLATLATELNASAVACGRG